MTDDYEHDVDVHYNTIIIIFRQHSFGFDEDEVAYQFDAQQEQPRRYDELWR